ncbi:Contact-dependent inhibition of growth factor CdiA, partial [Kosakonia sp. SOY2]|nr:Contact-dependent inhibition of growth factor CdiA [Kosakonia sp. SOY2]
LLNQRDGLNVTGWTEPATQTGVGKDKLYLSIQDFPVDGLTIKKWETHEYHNCTCQIDVTYYNSQYVPDVDEQIQKVASSIAHTSVSASGGAGSITSGRDISLYAGVLDNQASNILGARNIALYGTNLNNQSYQDGTAATYFTYKYSYTTDSSRSTKEYIAPSRNGYFLYELTGQTTEATNGQNYRAVIQAGGNVSANFSSNISNTSTTANAGGVSGTITAPSLNTLSNQSIGASVAKQALAAGPVTVNSPQWQDQLHNALQQINGGGALDNASANGAALANIGSQQKGSASLGSAGSLAGAGVTSAVLKDTHAGALDAHQGKAVDTSAYPLPSGNNGYFVVSANPKSPYLITVNPKLDGLGQLDPALFGDLNKLLGVTPSAAPRETSSTYTDEKQFLGSAYMLDRIKLNPDHDYRFLGDAAFDTRYVSNVVLNQTGNRYLNGIGSDLDQMRYLMDNAANT